MDRTAAMICDYAYVCSNKISFVSCLKMNLFYSLPADIVFVIYSFDPTYRTLFNNLLPDIPRAYTDYYKKIIDDLLYQYHSREHKYRYCPMSEFILDAFRTSGEGETLYNLEQLSEYFHCCDCCDKHQLNKSVIKDGKCTTNTHMNEVDVYDIDYVSSIIDTVCVGYDREDNGYIYCDCNCRLLSQYVAEAGSLLTSEK